jgi:hypothetical protein
MSMSKKYTTEEFDPVVVDYLAGMPIKALYDKYSDLGSSTTISRELRFRGAPNRANSGQKRKTCTECSEPVYRRNLCAKHYRVLLAEEKGSCNVKDCTTLQEARGLCGLHYQRLMKDQPMIKETATWVNSAGYVCEYIPNHIQASKDGRVLLHRKIISDQLGRKLESFENVHHKDGNRLNNHPDNLELWIVKQPAGQKPEDLVIWAKEILERYDK